MLAAGVHLFFFFSSASTSSVQFSSIMVEFSAETANTQFNLHFTLDLVNKEFRTRNIHSFIMSSLLYDTLLLWLESNFVCKELSWKTFFFAFAWSNLIVIVE